MGATVPKPRLSIIIPAYNEERRLPANLARLDEFVRASDRDIEVLAVENGSTDCTAEVVAEHMRTMPYLRLLQVPKPGKGGAVRAGMLAATGDHLMFCDADFSMPISEIDKFTALLDVGVPIVIASRELATSKRHHEPAERHVMGRVFNRFVQFFIVHGIDDTQCGFKAFQRPVARDLFGMQRIGGWGFDVEVLYLAKRRGYRVQQLAIDWYYDSDSRVRHLSATLSMVGEVMRIRLYDLIGAYRRRRPPVHDVPR
jgi:dolichyl-phosphate beta-glucosyltransferase